MITFKEYIGDEPINDIPIAEQHNAEHLLYKINKIIDKFEKDTGEKVEMSSGRRSMQKHMNIYAQINSKRVKNGLDPLRVPTKSSHLICKAIDLKDPHGKLQEWVLNNVNMLEDLALYCEDFAHCPGWVHMQTTKPKSGKRFFIP